MQKKRQYHLTYLIVFLFSFLFLTSCSLTPSSPKDFDTFTDELFRNDISQNTINLHYTLAYPENYSITDYPVTLGSYKIDEISDYSDLENLLEQLKSYKYEELTPEQQITYDMLEDYINTELSVKDLVFYSELLSPTVGYQAQLPILLAEYTFRTKEDIENYLELVSQIDELYEEIIIFEQEKSKAGLFMADFAVEDIITQCSDFIENPSDNYMIDTFNDKIDAFPDLTDSERSAYKEKNFQLITTDVVNGYTILINGLTALKGTGKNNGGLCNFKDGIRYYEYLVRTETGSSKSVKELQQMTEQYINNSMTKIATIIAMNPNILTEFETYSFDLTDPDEILQDLAQKVANDFPAPPEVHYTVKYVHESMEDSLSPAFYLTPPIDDMTENVIYINNASVSDDLYTTLAHEGYPGHLYQTIYTNTANLPLVRNLLGYSGYTEGWATYVEYYSYGISNLEEELSQVVALNGSASLGLYAYIDMGIHYDGWSVEDVRSYLSTFGITSQDTAQLIFDTMVEEPANYLSYFIGYLEILELKDKAEAALQDQFNLKDFHDFFLKFGPAPFDLIEKYMNIWIAEKN